MAFRLSVIDELVYLQSGWGGQYSFSMLGLRAEQAYGLNIAGALNRLTPMFVVRNTESNAQDRLYSTKPGVIQAGIIGEYLAVPSCAESFGCQYNLAMNDDTLRPYAAPPSPEAQPVMGGTYSLLLSSTITGFPAPRASFFVFATENSPWPGTALAPLYRLSFRAACDKRDTVYTSSIVERNYFETTDFCGDPGVQSYRFDGIEGYVISACPSQYGSCANFSDPTAPQALHRRYSALENSYALLTGSQIGLAQFSSYLPVLGQDVIGYVYPNVDTDGDKLIDGYERLIGTNRLLADSDCDLIQDGVEYLVLGPARLASPQYGQQGCP